MGAICNSRAVTNRSRAMLPAAGCLLALFLVPRAAARAGEGAALRQALGRRITVEVKDKPFDAAVRAMCRAAGIRDPEVGQPRKRSPGGGGRGSQGLGRRGREGRVSYRDAGGARLYSVQLTRPQPLKSLLKIICDQEGGDAGFRVAGDKLVVGTAAPAGPARAVKFRPGDFGRFRDRNNPESVRVVPVRDWRKAVEFIIRTGAQGIVENYNYYNGGGRRSSADAYERPSVKCLVRALGVLKAYREKDAVRAWMLSEAALRYWEQHRTYAALKDRAALEAMKHVAGMMQEVEGLEKTGAVKKNLAALAAAIRKGARGNRNVTYAHRDLARIKSDEVLFKYQLSWGYLAAARALEHMGDRKAASRAMDKAAHYPLALDANADWWLPLHYLLLPVDKKAEAAAADLAGVTERLRKARDRYRALPADWKHPVSGLDREMLLKVVDAVQARYHYRLGLQQTAAGLHEQAHRSFTAAMSLDPFDGGYHRATDKRRLLIGHFLVDGGEMETSDIPRVVRLAADALEKAGKPKEALEFTMKQVAAGRADDRLLLHLAKSCEAAGRNDDAISAYKRYLAGNPEKSVDIRLQSDYARTRLAVLEGRIVEGPRSDVSDPETRKLREQVSREVSKMLSARRYEAGLAMVRSEALKHFPGDFDFLKREVEFLEKLPGREAELKKKLLALKKLHPQQARWVQGRLEHLDRRTSGFDALLRRAQELQRAKKYDEAVKVLRAGHKQFENRRPDLIVSELHLLRSAKRYEKMIELARDAAGKYPDHKCDFLAMEMYHYLRTGNTAELKKRAPEFNAAYSKLEGRQARRYSRLYWTIFHAADPGGGGNWVKTPDGPRRVRPGKKGAAGR